MARTVVHLARLFAPHIGGVEKHVGELVKLHQKNGDAVTVITEQYKSALPLEEAKDGYRILRIPKELREDKVGIWRWMWQRRNLLQTADIIQAHDVFWWLLPLYPLLFKKVYTTFHGWETAFPIPITNKLQRFIYAKLSQKTVHVGNWIREFYWDTPTAVTYGGVQPQEVLETPESNTDELKISFLGRLEPDTAVPQYLELLEHFSSSLPHLDLQVTWIGEGSMHLQCEQWGKVTGYVPNPAPYIANTDIVFASSYLSILEAQSFGKLVTALYDNKLKERYLKTFPGAKHMIIAGKPKSAGLKLKKLIKRPKQLTTKGKKARAFATEQTWEKVFDLYEEKIWR